METSMLFCSGCITEQEPFMLHPTMLAPAWACWWLHGVPHWRSSWNHTKVPACLPTFIFGRNSISIDNQSTAKSSLQSYHMLQMQAGPRNSFFTKYRLSQRVWLGCFDLWPGCTQLSQPFKIFITALSQNESSGLSSVFAFTSNNHGEEWSFLSSFLPPLHSITCTAVQVGTEKGLQTLRCSSPLSLDM